MPEVALFEEKRIVERKFSLHHKFYFIYFSQELAKDNDVFFTENGLVCGVISELWKILIRQRLILDPSSKF